MGYDRYLHLSWPIVRACVFYGFLEILYRQNEPGIPITRGDPKGTRRPAGARLPVLFSSDPTRQTGRTRPGIPAGYPVNGNQGPTSNRLVYPVPLWSKSGTFLFQCSPRPQGAI